MEKEGGPEFRTVRGYERISQESGQLSPALEDYLEMVYRQCRLNQYTRVGRVAELLHVTPSSASKMVFKLAGQEYLKYEQHEIILLTDKGRTLGSFLLARHNTVDSVLRLIGIRDSLEETELIEHSLSRNTVRHLELLLEFFKASPAANEAFAEYLKNSLK